MVVTPMLIGLIGDVRSVVGVGSARSYLYSRGYLSVPLAGYQIQEIVIGPMAPDLSRGPFIYLAAPDSPQAYKDAADVVEVGAAMNEIQDAIDTLATACVTACGTVVLMPGTHDLGNVPSAIVTGARLYVLMKDGVDLTGYGSLTVVTITDATDYPDDVHMFHAVPGTDVGTWGVDDVMVSRIKFDQTAAPTPVTNNRHPLAMLTTNAVFSYLWFVGGEEEIQTSENTTYGRFIPSDNYYHHIRCENTSAACVEFQRSTTNATLEDFYCLNCGIDEFLALHMEAFSGGLTERPTNITLTRTSFEADPGVASHVSITGVDGLTVTDMVLKGMGDSFAVDKSAVRLNTTLSGGTRIEDAYFTNVNLAESGNAEGTGQIFGMTGDLVNVRVLR